MYGKAVVIVNIIPRQSKQELGEFKETFSWISIFADGAFFLIQWIN